MFWSPCDAHCLDLILADACFLYDTIANVKRIIVSVYHHTLVINLYRIFARGNELVRSAVTRFATAYFILQTMGEMKTTLRSMFASKLLVTSLFASRLEGKKL